jgi:hypothetical protein
MGGEILSIQFNKSEILICPSLITSSGDALASMIFCTDELVCEPNGVFLQNQTTNPNYRNQHLMRQLHTKAFDMLRKEGYEFVDTFIPQCIVYDRKHKNFTCNWIPSFGDEPRGGMRSLWPLSSITLLDSTSPSVSLRQISSEEIDGNIIIGAGIRIDLTQSVNITQDPADIFQRLVNIAQDLHLTTRKGLCYLQLDEMVPLNF